MQQFYGIFKWNIHLRPLEKHVFVFQTLATTVSSVIESAGIVAVSTKVISCVRIKRSINWFVGSSPVLSVHEHSQVMNFLLPKHFT